MSREISRKARGSPSQTCDSIAVFEAARSTFSTRSISGRARHKRLPKKSFGTVAAGLSFGLRFAAAAPTETKRPTVGSEDKG
jgi:hypothetical protein